MDAQRVPDEKRREREGTNVKKAGTTSAGSPSERIDARLAELADRRGETLRPR